MPDLSFVLDLARSFGTPTHLSIIAIFATILACVRFSTWIAQSARALLSIAMKADLDLLAHRVKRKELVEKLKPK